MNDITNAKTADLIVEWEGHRDFLSQLESDHAVTPILGDLREISFQKSQLATIAAELDRRCDDAGISVDINGAPNFANCGHSMDGSFTIYSNATREHIPAAELRNLLTWLLLKEGGG